MLDASHFWQDEQGELASKYVKKWALSKGWINSEK